MITDAQSNFVFFSELLNSKLEFKSFYNQLTAILDKHKISYGLLPETNDIWCRDYMPVQVSEKKLIEYRYDPDYLQSKKERINKTYSDIVCDALQLKTIKTGLILDGGNVIKSNDKVILTDKVLIENKHTYSRDQVVSMLKTLFEVNDIIFIPWDRANEDYGHADGMVRFVNENKVLINGYFKEYDSKFNNTFFSALSEHDLDYIELNYNVKSPNEDLNWGYINYLQMKDLILVPQFGIEEDQQALNQICQVFPENAAKKQIETINASVILKYGGALNCISWNILK
jgi:agmatine/peptidylarginine deiminase